MTFNELIYICGPNVFEVGGCVRDEIMNIPINDYDYCVVSDVKSFESSFPNAVPVGNNFPVYLFRKGDECVEVSLTRLEKSNGVGYNDFEVTHVGVSIEEDLSRRDFTINSFAKNYITGEIIDPFGGQEDVKKKLIRTINPDCFSDDPLRLIRAARFAARFDFNIEEKTFEMMKDNANSIVHIPKERIVLELEKVYKGNGNYKKFFDVLSECGVLKYIFPDVEMLKLVPAGPEKYHGNLTAYEHTMNVVDKTKGKGFHVFVAALFHDIGKGKTSKEILPHHFGHELESYYMLKEFMSNHCFDSFTRDFAIFCALNHMKAHVIHKMRTTKLINFFKNIPRRYYVDFLVMVNCDHEFNEEQKLVKKKLDILRETCKIDVDRVKAVKDKEREVKRQMVEFYNKLEV